MDKEYSLRDRKRAKQKVSLANEFVDRLRSEAFEDIVVKDICTSVDVSEGTFYNYFDKKSDVMMFFRDLSFAKMTWALHKGSYTNVFEKLLLFVDILSDTLTHPHVFYEFASVAIKEKMKEEKVFLSEVELVVAFPGCDGIINFSGYSPLRLFGEIVEEALLSGEITVSQEEAVRALHVMMIGIPLSLEEKNFDNLKEAYRQQLKITWRGMQ
jgi:AcrR family transcriptional regulator